MRNVLSALKVLEEVCEHGPVGVSELARITGMPKSTVQRCLVTLGDARWLESTLGDPVRWQVSAKARRIVGKSQQDMSLRETARPVMERVRAELDETVHLTVLDGDAAVLIERVDSTKPVRAYSALGISVPLHGPSSGKVLLAFMDSTWQERYIDGDLTEYTPETKTDKKQLRADLDLTRKRGYAVNRGEWRDEISGVGVPIRAGDRQVVAALSVSMPSFRFQEAMIPTIAKTLQVAARDIGDGLT